MLWRLRYNLKYYQRFNQPMWRPIQLAVTVLVIAGLTLVCGSVWAQRNQKQFPVGKLVKSSALYCLNANAAMQVAKLLHEGKPATEETLLESGDCFLFMGHITYGKKVGAVGAWNVYEAVLRNGAVLYEPTDWEANGSL